MEQPHGRRDQKASTQSIGLFGWVVLAVIVAFSWWHLVLAATSNVGIGDVMVSGEAAGTLVGSGEVDPALGGLSTTATAVVYLVGLFLVGVIVLVVRDRFIQRSHASRQGKGMATRRQIREALGAKALTERSKFPRHQTLEDDPGIAPEHLGFHLGSCQGEDVYLPTSSHVMLLAPTEGGKTQRVMSRAALDAQGPLVVASTKPDLLDIAAGPRGEVGTVWVFDPAGRARWPTPMSWDPVAGCTDPHVADARGALFVGAMGDSTGGNAEFFNKTAIDLLGLTFAAAAFDHRTMTDVAQWITEIESTSAPMAILDEHTDVEPLLAARLRSVAKGADETVSSTRQSVMNALRPIGTSAVLNQLKPRPGVAAFDPAAFVRSTDTLFVIADDNAQANLSPLASMLIGEVIEQAKDAALDGGGDSDFLDPPLTLVIDEVANVAPLPKLPEQLSDLRGYGIQIIHAHQSMARARRRWGKDQAVELAANSTLLVLGGIKETEFLKDLSDLIGEVETREVSTSSSERAGNLSATTTLRDRRVMRPDEIRAVGEGKGLLIAPRVPPLVVDLPTWRDRRDAKEIAAARTETRAKRRGKREEVNTVSTVETAVAP